MGRFLNPSGDKIPGKPIYDACRIIARHVRSSGDLSWDFTELHSGDIDQEFTEMVMTYLEDVLAAGNSHKGWKLPETTLAYPWIARMFPRARYLYIVRDPRDCLLRKHGTDDLGQYAVPGLTAVSVLDRRVESWKYQYDIVKATPRPARFALVRYEDLILDHEAAVGRLEDFLGIRLARIVVDGTRIGQWKDDRDILNHLLPLQDAMLECGYE